MSYYLSPFRGFSLGFPRFDSLLDSVFDDTIFSSARHFSIDETDAAYNLVLELPGFKQSEIEVTLEQETLTVVAKREQRSYSQSVIIPRGVDSNKIEAKLEDGLLSIVLPKNELAKPRKVTIK